MSEENEIDMTHDDGTSTTRQRRAIRTSADVQRLLEVEILRLLAEPEGEPLKRARMIAELARVMLLAIRQGTLEDRLAALTETLKFRQTAQGATHE
jgi:hypothetical protein